MKQHQHHTRRPAAAEAHLLILVTLAFWLGALPSLQAQAVPDYMNYQGILLNGQGAPITTPTDVEFRIWSSATETATNYLMWGRMFRITPDTNGAFNVVLSQEGAPLSGAPNVTLSGVFTSPGSDSRYLELTVFNSTAIRPRQRFVASPYAMLAYDLTPRQSFTVNGPLTVSGAANVNSLTTPGAVTALSVAATTVNVAALIATNGTVSGALGVAGAVTAGSFVGNGVGITNINTNNLVQQVVEALCPPGTIVAFGGTSVPPGWLLCNGQSLLRSSYPRLFSAISTSWGSASSTYFNLPDLRGYFLRGTDGGVGRDPNRATRFALYTGGAVGDAVGTFQADAMQNVTGVVGQWNGFSGLGANVSSGPFYETEDVVSGQGGPGGYSDPHDKISFDLSRSARTSTETRPSNASVNYIIKY